MRCKTTSVIRTERLILRAFDENDLSDMAEWASDPAVQLEYGEPVYPDTDAVRELLHKYLSAYADPDYYRWAIHLRDTGEGIGQIGFCRVYDDIHTAEIEYCIARKHWGRGFAGEALRSVIRWTFAETDFVMLEAYARAENTKSVRVLEKSLLLPADTVERFRRAGINPDGEKCFCIPKDGAISL